MLQIQAIGLRATPTRTLTAPRFAKTPQEIDALFQDISTRFNVPIPTLNQMTGDAFVQAIGTYLQTALKAAKRPQRGQPPDPLFSITLAHTQVSHDPNRQQNIRDILARVP